MAFRAVAYILAELDDTLAEVERGALLLAEQMERQAQSRLAPYAGKFRQLRHCIVEQYGVVI